LGNGAEVSDPLKYFSERIPATFIYAGVDVERVGLFAGTCGSTVVRRLARANHLRLTCTLTSAAHLTTSGLPICSGWPPSAAGPPRCSTAP